MSRYEEAKKIYAQYGIDTEAAMERLSKLSVSVHCWQGDDVIGFDGSDSLSGGIHRTVQSCLADGPDKLAKQRFPLRAHFLHKRLQRRRRIDRSFLDTAKHAQRVKILFSANILKRTNGDIAIFLQQAQQIRLAVCYYQNAVHIYSPNKKIVLL